uniref:hypothetical protein n=1 Tax=Parerythrobacter lutipelagi TaxID=1964208 RepID=UPI0010F97C18|nr:hypothetical protein [Parerythrobacter lutipelagi]
MAPTLHNTDLSFDRFVAELSSLSNDELSELIGSGSILDEPAFSMGRSSDLAAFYAPFDWINEDANIVLLGVTPGKQQAEAAPAALRHSLRSGSSVGDAMRIAKQSASFAGEMRTIATRLMDHFRMNDLFGLASASELFGRSSNRVHYTSVDRYPVLQKKGSQLDQLSRRNFKGRPRKSTFARHGSRLPYSGIEDAGECLACSIRPYPGYHPR